MKVSSDESDWNSQRARVNLKSALTRLPDASKNTSALFIWSFLYVSRSISLSRLVRGISTFKLAHAKNELMRWQERDPRKYQHSLRIAGSSKGALPSVEMIWPLPQTTQTEAS